MPTITRYAKTIAQSAAAKEVKFNNLVNVNQGNGFAKTGLIAGKTGAKNKPSTITVTNFNINLPTGAEVSKVTVEYMHGIEKYKGKTPSIPAPAIVLLNVGVNSLKAKTPTTTMSKGAVSWTFTGDITSKLKSSNFGVKINYPRNTSSNRGYLKLQYLRVVVTYKKPEYSFVLSAADAEQGQETILKTIINNTGGTKYNPQVQIILPDTVELHSSSGDGSMTNTDGDLVWSPNITSKTTSRTVYLTLGCLEVGEENTITVSEPTTKANKSVNFNILSPSGSDGQDETINDKQLPSNFDFTIRKDLEQELHIFYEDKELITNITDFITFDIQYILRSNKEYLQFETPVLGGENTWGSSFISNEPVFNVNAKCNVYGVYTATLERQVTLVFDGDRIDEIEEFLEDNPNFNPETYTGTTEVAVFNIQCTPDIASLGLPESTILQITGEELDRIGDSCLYTVQSYVEVLTNEEYPHDWGKNYRMGLFNNQISSNITYEEVTDEETGETYTNEVDTTDYNNLTDEEIINNAKYWTQSVTLQNEYENLTLDFEYDENYPLYIIFTGDYTENTIRNQLNFTSPVIVETEYFKGYEKTGNYPTPIQSVIISDDTASITIPVMDTATPVIAYQLPVPELPENTIVKGIEVSLNIDYADSLIIECKLRNQNGLIGERSIAITSNEDIITLGTPTDKWGFKTSELSDFKNWEIELTAQDLIDTIDESTIIFNNLTITLHTSIVKDARVSCAIDGEAIAAYNAFIQDIEIPAGLETDTKFLKVDGTDTNDAYRQTIKEKEITLKFAIRGCTLEENTQYLQEITQLLMNERNNLNNPIPKRIEFDHYPGLYWEYIMESPLKVTTDISRYNCEAKLTIPSGTAFSDEEIITGSNGKIDGLAKVNPIITICYPEENIQILEEYSNQSFSIHHNDFRINDVVEIDCINQKVTYYRDDQLIDITKDVDYTSDWFKLIGQYSFTSNGCVIQTVARTERR